jgi:hypothetical protein
MDPSRNMSKYLNNIQIIKDEEKLHLMSLECEPAIVVPALNSVTIRRQTARAAKTMK